MPIAPRLRCARLFSDQPPVDQDPGKWASTNKMKGTMQTQKQTNPQPSREQIATTAYQLWEKAGRPSAREMDFWLQAERQLGQTSGKPKTESNPGGNATQATAGPKPASSARAQSL